MIKIVAQGMGFYGCAIVTTDKSNDEIVAALQKAGFTEIRPIGWVNPDRAGEAQSQRNMGLHPVASKVVANQPQSCGKSKPKIFNLSRFPFAFSTPDHLTKICKHSTTS